MSYPKLPDGPLSQVATSQRQQLRQTQKNDPAKDSDLRMGTTSVRQYDTFAETHETSQQQSSFFAPIEKFNQLKSITTKQDEDLNVLEKNLQNKVSDIESTVKMLLELRTKMIDLSSSVENEGQRTRHDFDKQLIKIEQIKSDLQIVNVLEKRLADATGRVDDYKIRLKAVREAIDQQYKLQADFERRSFTTRTVCVASIFIALLAWAVISLAF
ncbi:uncharacterized protein V1510DRAFT_51450 [Dipodascopsis tothii]|uniref:uncharacterized protein n=1 Tax=Dipodascopsis tothii TaxID=44089 RepID=UPI0034CD5371